MRESESPFVFIPGGRSGWFISLTWNHGAPVEVSSRQLRKLLASSQEDAVIARRLVGEELRFFEQYRIDIGAEVHALLIFKDHMRWRPTRKR